MSVIKSFAVGNGDMFYIRHDTDNFSIIDCDLGDDNAEAIIAELKLVSSDRGITRFISTHPDEDHFGGIDRLDDAMPINNFYVVKNKAIKDRATRSFERYRTLRDGDKAFFIHKGVQRRWMNLSSDERSTSGISVLWPDVENQHFKAALANAESGVSFNDISAVLRYKLANGASFLWLGDLHTDFMKEIEDDISLDKTTVVFASHHGRQSGRIPHSWLRRLDPQIIVIGEAPSRHLNYYTGYETLTQNSVGHITFKCVEDKVHIYTSNYMARPAWMSNEGVAGGDYVGSITVETNYTLKNMGD
jgi:beta-lactamase superfamily II metal-dependent hydrolase